MKSSQEYPVSHFEFMLGLARMLAPVPVQILEHHYSHESFGSWWFTCRHSGKQYRIVFDGKEDCFYFQRPQGRDWEDLSSLAAANVDLERLLRQILTVLKAA